MGIDIDKRCVGRLLSAIALMSLALQSTAHADFADIQYDGTKITPVASTVGGKGLLLQQHLPTPADYFQPPKFTTGISADASPVKIVASGHAFMIPRNYLEVLVANHEKVLFGLITFFPDFKGATPETLSRYESKNRYKVPNAIEIVRTSYVDSAFSSGFEQFIEETKKNTR